MGSGGSRGNEGRLVFWEKMNSDSESIQPADAIDSIAVKRYICPAVYGCNCGGRPRARSTALSHKRGAELQIRRETVHQDLPFPYAELYTERPDHESDNSHSPLFNVDATQLNSKVSTDCIGDEGNVSKTADEDLSLRSNIHRQNEQDFNRTPAETLCQNRSTSEMDIFVAENGLMDVCASNSDSFDDTSAYHSPSMVTASNN